MQQKNENEDQLNDLLRMQTDPVDICNYFTHLQSSSIWSQAVIDRQSISEALAMHNGWAIFFILALADPHLLEGRQG